MWEIVKISYAKVNLFAMECSELVNLLGRMTIEDIPALVELIRFAKKLDAWQGKIDANSLRDVRLLLEMGATLRINEACPEDMRDVVRVEIEKSMASLQKIEGVLTWHHRKKIERVLARVQ